MRLRPVAEALRSGRIRRRCARPRATAGRPIRAVCGHGPRCGAAGRRGAGSMRGNSASQSGPFVRGLGPCRGPGGPRSGLACGPLHVRPRIRFAGAREDRARGIGARARSRHGSRVPPACLLLPGVAHMEQEAGRQREHLLALSSPSCRSPARACRARAATRAHRGSSRRPACARRRTPVGGIRNTRCRSVTAKSWTIGRLRHRHQRRRGAVRLRARSRRAPAGPGSQLTPKFQTVPSGSTFGWAENGTPARSARQVFRPSVSSVRRVHAAWPSRLPTARAPRRASAARWCWRR